MCNWIDIDCIELPRVDAVLLLNWHLHTLERQVFLFSFFKNEIESIQYLIYSSNDTLYQCPTFITFKLFYFNWFQSICQIENGAQAGEVDLHTAMLELAGFKRQVFCLCCVCVFIFLHLYLCICIYNHGTVCAMNCRLLPPLDVGAPHGLCCSSGYIHT